MNQLITTVDSLNNGLKSIDSMNPLVIKDKIYGYIHPDFYNILEQFKVFNKSNDRVELIDSLKSSDCNQLSNIFANISIQLKDKKVITGWRNELSRVVQSFNDDPVCLIERSVYHYYGFKGYGVHVNGFVRDKDTKQISHIWVAKRSVNKSLWPGMLDHIVAGGQPFDISPSDNVIKECGEEANIPIEMAKRALSVGAVSYITIEGMQIKRDSLFCYDLELDDEFIPKPVDGEVAYFQLKSIDWVLDKVIKGGSDGYKPNCNLVIIDFFIRHGIISADTNRYLELLSKLRGPSCS